MCLRVKEEQQIKIKNLYENELGPTVNRRPWNQVTFLNDFIKSSTTFLWAAQGGAKILTIAMVKVPDKNLKIWDAMFESNWSNND